MEAAQGERQAGPVWLRSRFAALGILIALNLGVFVLQIVTAPLSDTLDGDLVVHGGVNGPEVDQGEWWRIVTGGFLHSGLPHLFGNLVALVILGGILTLSVGPLRMVAVYAAGLLGASLSVLLLTPDTLTVGASGAIFGLAGGALLVGWRRKKLFLLVFAAAWTIYTLASTLFVPGISQAGHLGGLVTGAAMGWLLVGEKEELRQGATVVAMAVGLLLALGFLALIV